MNVTEIPIINETFLEEVVRRILTVGVPLKIVLFGSHARGEARPDSDLDLLIIEEHSDLPRYERANPYRMALTGIHPSKDIMVFTPAEILATTSEASTAALSVASGKKPSACMALTLSLKTRVTKAMSSSECAVVR